MIRIKQKWGLALLLFLSCIYVIVFFMVRGSQKEGVMEIYFADRMTAAHRILIEKYNMENEGRVKIIPIDFSNYNFSTNERKELLARSLRGRGDGIDLFAVDLIWVQRFAKWCEPFDKYFTKEEVDKLLELTLESCYCEGELVAVPLDVVQGILYYREDLIKNMKNGEKILADIQKDLTWNDFVSLGKKIDGDNPFYIFPAADYEGLICIYMELLLSLEPDYFNKWGFKLDTPSAKKALSLLVNFVNKYNLTPEAVTEFTELPSYDYFIKNDGLFIRGWQSYDKDFKESPFDVEKEKHLKKIPMPYFSGGKKVSIFGGWNLMMSKFSEKKDEVVKFVKFLLSESSQEMFYKEAGHNPIIKKFYTDEKYRKRYPEITELIKIYDTGMHRPAHVEYTKYSKIISHYLKSAIKMELSVDDALHKATEDILLDKMLVK